MPMEIKRGSYMAAEGSSIPPGSFAEKRVLGISVPNGLKIRYCRRKRLYDEYLRKAGGFACCSET